MPNLATHVEDLPARATGAGWAVGPVERDYFGDQRVTYMSDDATMRVCFDQFGKLVAANLLTGGRHWRTASIVQARNWLHELPAPESRPGEL